VVIPLHGERVQVGTREVENGAVRLRKVVRTETVNQPVTLKREELVVDRLPAGEGGAAQNGNAPQTVDLNQAFTEQSITIPLHRQEPVVQTQVVQTGEVVAQKRVAAEATTVQQPVRTEDVQVVKIGQPTDVNVAPSLSGAGAAPGYQAGSATATGAAPISSLAGLANTADLLSLARRQVQLPMVPVNEVIGDRVVSLRAPDGQVFYVRAPNALTGIRAGDLVDVQGLVRAVPNTIADLGLNSDAAAALQSQPIYIDASSVRSVRR